MPLYSIPIYRPERGEIDRVSIRADTRDDAKAYVAKMYPTGTIVERKPK